MSNLSDPKLLEDIARIRKMATDDPDNELGHFRLGKLLMDADNHAEAADSFRRTLELNPDFSKVFQLLASCLVRLDHKADAIKVLRSGIAIAEQRGDNVPREEMVKMLVDLGETPPAPKRRRPKSPAAAFVVNAPVVRRAHTRTNSPSLR